MKYIMRFNDYKNDPYSEGNPMNSICSRGDLRDPPTAGGCYDTKVMSGLKIIDIEYQVLFVVCDSIVGEHSYIGSCYLQYNPFLQNKISSIQFKLNQLVTHK